MPRDMATLLAQLIPVVALAGGIELRTLAKRYDTLTDQVEHHSRAHQHADDKVRESKANRLNLTILIISMALGQVFLAVAEKHALDSAFGEHLGFRNTAVTGVLQLVLAVTFIAPAYEATSRVFVLTLPHGKFGPPNGVYAALLAVFTLAFAAIATLFKLG